MSAPQPKQSRFEGARRPWRESSGPADAWRSPTSPPEQVAQCLSCEKPAIHCTGMCFYNDYLRHRSKRGEKPPEGFAEAWASGARIKDLCREFQAGTTSVAAWVEQLGLPPRPVGRGKRPMPEDFREMAEKLISKNKLKQHFRASDPVVKRWLEEMKSAAHGCGEP